MRGGKSFTAAARRERLKPQTFRRHAGKALRQKHPGGRLYAAPSDTLQREMIVQTTEGPQRLAIRGLKQARLVSAHANAIAQFNRDGKFDGLRPFEGQTIRSGGRVFTLLTDPIRLRELGEADALRLDSLYDGD
jgi:hypothetical protein